MWWCTLATQAHVPSVANVPRRQLSVRQKCLNYQVQHGKVIPNARDLPPVRTYHTSKTLRNLRTMVITRPVSFNGVPPEEMLPLGVQFHAGLSRTNWINFGPGRSVAMGTRKRTKVEQLVTTSWCLRVGVLERCQFVINSRGSWLRLRCRRLLFWFRQVWFRSLDFKVGVYRMTISTSSI